MAADRANQEFLILVVDDEANIVRSLIRCISEMGYAVRGTTSCQEAMDLLRSSPVAVFLCDQKMREMSGPELLEMSYDISPDTQRVSITGHSMIEMIVDAINRGHTHHFLFKPWDNKNLREIIDHCYHQYSLIRQKERLERENEAHRNKLKDLSDRLINFSHNQQVMLGTGWTLQHSMLLDILPQRIGDVEFASRTLPAHDLDGDFIFCHQLTADIIDLVIGDVMGKGLPAALAAASLRGQFMHEWGRAEGLGPERHRPCQIVSKVQEAIAPRLLPLGAFVSLFYLRLDLTAHRLSYVDCGSVKPILYTAREGSIRTLEGDNCPLGIPEGGDKITEISTSFLPGDIIVLYSDGLAEETNKDETEFFGTDRIKKCLEGSFAKSPIGIINHLFDEAVNFRGDIRQQDDLTCLVCKLHHPGLATEEKPMSLNRQGEELELTASYDSIESIHQLLRDVGQQCSFSTSRIEAVILAIHEAFVNIIKHAYAGVQSKPVWINWYCDNQFLHVILYDYGISFEHDQTRAPDFSGGSESGFGLYIIHQLADKVLYDRDNKARNFLQISFLLTEQTP